MIRIVTCIDFDTDDAVEAYRAWHALWDRVDGLNLEVSCEAETTDEWFDAAGEPMDTLVVFQAREIINGQRGL